MTIFPAKLPNPILLVMVRLFSDAQTGRAPAIGWSFLIHKHQHCHSRRRLTSRPAGLPNAVERQLASADDFSILQERLSHSNSSLGEVSIAHDQLIGRMVTFNQIKSGFGR